MHMFNEEKTSHFRNYHVEKIRLESITNRRTLIYLVSYYSLLDRDNLYFELNLLAE